MARKNLEASSINKQCFSNNNNSLRLIFKMVAFFLPLCTYSIIYILSAITEDIEIYLNCEYTLSCTCIFINNKNSLLKKRNRLIAIC